MALMPGTPTQRGVSSTSGVITPSWQLASRIFHGLTAPASAHSVHVALKSFVAHGEVLAAVVEGVVPSRRVVVRPPGPRPLSNRVTG
jgi:hypothetical protein